MSPRRRVAASPPGYRLELLRLLLFFLAAPFFGILAPDSRASLNAMATACFRLVTFLPDRPERRVPCLRSCMALPVLLFAALP